MMIKRFIALAMFAFTLAFGAGTAVGQTTENVVTEIVELPTKVKTYESYVGVQVVRVNPDVRQPNFRFDRTTDSVGVNASLTRYFNDSPVGVTGELAANFDADDTDSSLVTAQVGLTAKARRDKRVQPFLRGLVGVGRVRAANEQINPVTFFDRSDTGLAFTTGAGVDVVLGKRVGWRVVQVDYLQTRAFGDPVHNVRIGTGFIF